MRAKLGCAMTAAVVEARRLANELLKLESRGAGDLENAMRRLGHRYDIPWRVFWNLRYRAPSDLFVSVFEKLKEAHRAECGRQIERLRHEIQIAEINGVHVQDLADQVEALASELEACVAKRSRGNA